jgi:hypothetical protein
MAYIPPSLPYQRLGFNLGSGSVTIPSGGTAVLSPQVVYNPTTFDPKQGRFYFLVTGTQFKVTNLIAPDDFQASLSLEDNAANIIKALNYVPGGGEGGPGTYTNLVANGLPGGPDPQVTIANLPLYLKFYIISTGAFGGTWAWNNITGYMLANMP